MATGACPPPNMVRGDRRLPGLQAGLAALLNPLAPGRKQEMVRDLCATFHVPGRAAASLTTFPVTRSRSNLGMAVSVPNPGNRGKYDCCPGGGVQMGFGGLSGARPPFPHQILFWSDLGGPAEITRQGGPLGKCRFFQPHVAFPLCKRRFQLSRGVQTTRTMLEVGFHCA